MTYTVTLSKEQLGNLAELLLAGVADDRRAIDKLAESNGSPRDMAKLLAQIDMAYATLTALNEGVELVDDEPTDSAGRPLYLREENIEDDVKELG